MSFVTYRRYTRAVYLRPVYTPGSQTPALSTRSDSTIAIATVNGPVTARFEGYFGILTTFGTRHRKHLTSGPVAAVSVTLGLPGLATFGTALGLISVAFGLEELLVLSAESEAGPTIGALKRLVLKSHRMTSLSDILVRARSPDTQLIWNDMKSLIT